MTAAKRSQAGCTHGRANGSKTARRKAVLFCPVCNHDASIEHGWAVDDRAGDHPRVDVECPKCGHVVVSQPLFPGAGEKSDSLLGVRPILRLVDSIVRHDVL